MSRKGKKNQKTTILLKKKITKLLERLGLRVSDFILVYEPLCTKF